MGLISGVAGLFGGDAGDYFSGMETPDIEAMKLALEEYVSQGILTPEDAKAVLADPSAFEQITSSPEFEEAQMRALTGLQDVAEQGGMTAQTKARMNDIAKDEGIRERGSREAILQNAAEKGTSGSGLEFLSMLKNQQDSAGRVSDRDTQVAADAEQRALQALVDSGDMGTNMRSQEFNEQSRVAEAKDLINKFNTQNKNQVGMYNTQTRNNAQAANLNAKQGLANSNTDLRNKQQSYNKGLLQTDYENKLGLAGAKARAYESDRARKDAALGGIEQGIGGALGAYMDYDMDKEKLKKGIK